ncbi:hypothetical protein GCM10027594_01520 [Hymenobacter agri]
MTTERPKAEFDWLTFLSNWHEKEYERRYTLENVLVTPITLLTGAYGLTYLLASQYDYKHTNNWALVLFGLALLAGFVLTCQSTFFAYKSYAVLKNGVYKGIPDATALRKHMDDLVLYYRQNEPTADGVQEFKDYFVDLLAQQITVNVVNNDNRTVNLQKSKKPIARAFIALAVGLLCFFVNQWSKPDTVYQVAIIPQPSTSVSKTTTSPPQTVPLRRPTPPPHREKLDIPPPNQPTLER